MITHARAMFSLFLKLFIEKIDTVVTPRDEIRYHYINQIIFDTH